MAFITFCKLKTVEQTIEKRNQANRYGQQFNFQTEEKILLKFSWAHSKFEKSDSNNKVRDFSIQYACTLWKQSVKIPE